MAPILSAMLRKVYNSNKIFMTFLRFITILFFIVLPLNAQKIDSLFANSLFYNSIYDDGSVIDSSYISNLVQKIENSEGAEKVGFLFKLLNGYYFYRPEISRDLGEQALKIALEIEDDSLTAYAYHYTGLAYKYLGYKRISLDLYAKGLNTSFAKKTNNYRSWVTFNSGVNYFDLGLPDTAAAYYYEAIRLNEKVGNNTFAAKTYLELCRLYYSTGNYDESLANFWQSLSLLDLEKEKRVAAKLYTKRFLIALQNSQLDSADFYVDEALSSARQLNDSSLIANIYFEYGNQLFAKDYFEKALQNFDIGISYVNYNLYKLEYSSFLHGIGKTQLYLDNTNEARNKIFEAISLIEDHPEKELMQQFELTLAKLYAKTGEWEKFNFHFRNAEKYGLENIAEKEIFAIEELKTVYETGKKDQKIQYQEFQISAQQKQIWLLVAIVAAILIVLAVIYYYSGKVKERNNELYLQNQELSRQWHELQGFYLKCTPPEDETKESKTLFQNLITLFNEESVYKKNDLNLEYLAKRLNTNVKYISNSIKDQTEMNFNTFVNTYRIEEAKTLLRDSKSDNLTMEAIAEECGFNNQTSFYQAFKRNTGLTPSQYRNFKVA